MQLAPTAVADVDGGSHQPVVSNRRKQVGHPLDKATAVAIGLRQHPAQLIDDDACPAGRVAVRVEDAQQAARTDRGGGERTLGLQRPLQDLALGASPKLAKLVAMREELRGLWTRTGVSAEQLVADLQAWCRKAEESGIAALHDFSLKLRAAAHA